MKLSVGIYLVRLTNQFWAAKSLTSNTSGGRAINTFLSRYLNDSFYAFLGISYVGVLLSEAAECRPFSNYWQVIPTATPACRVSYAHLFTMGIFNILTDLALVTLPLPMTFSARLPTKIKAETLLLMLFPLLNIAFTCYRLPSIVADGGSQRHRTLLASIDFLISTVSSNALVVVSFLQDRGFKKLKYHYQHGDDGPIEQMDAGGIELKSINNLGSLAALRAASTGRRMPQLPLQARPTWGSDEDLMRDDSDGAPTVHTTSAQDAELGSSDMADLGTEGKVVTRANHLLPKKMARMSLVAPRRVGFAGHDEDIVQQSRAQPRRESMHRGIVVRTSWSVQVSQTK